MGGAVSPRQCCNVRQVMIYLLCWDFYCEKCERLHEQQGSQRALPAYTNPAVRRVGCVHRHPIVSCSSGPLVRQRLACNSRPRNAADISNLGFPMTRKKTDLPAIENPSDAIASIKYPAKRKNIPPAGLEAQGILQEAPRIRYEYNPHLPPVLRSSKKPAEADRLPELLATARQRAISAEEAKFLADALRKHEPWLEWSGKREKPWFEVEPVALHMHERISTQAILRVLAREDTRPSSPSPSPRSRPDRRQSRLSRCARIHGAPLYAAFRSLATYSCRHGEP